MQKAKIRATLKNQRIQKSRYLENPKQLEIFPKKCYKYKKFKKPKKNKKCKKYLTILKLQKLSKYKWKMQETQPSCIYQHFVLGFFYMSEEIFFCII